MLTKNEKKLIRVLLFSFGEKYSINEIARICNIAPNGALKILKKLEKERIIVLEKIANISSYSIDFSNIKTKSILELSLIEEGNGRVVSRFEDLKELQKITSIGVIFGSYVTDKQNPEDMDLFFVLNKESFRRYKEEIKKIYPAMPVKVHDVLQTPEDLEKNILKKDKVIIDILRKGFILWGHDKLIEAIKNIYFG